MKTVHKAGLAVTASAAIALAVAGLKPDEGLSLTPYFDIAGVKTWCIGETLGTPKAKYTPQECDELLNSRVYRDYYTPLTKQIPGFTSFAAETQSAVTRLSYNIGVAGTVNGSVGRLLTLGRIKEACDAFLLYNKARVKGKLVEVRGLTLRRERERKQCLQGA